jgi:hypothetical protein
MSAVAFVWNAKLEQDLLLLFVETCPAESQLHADERLWRG